MIRCSRDLALSRPTRPRGGLRGPPEATPINDQPSDAHNRVRRDRVDSTGVVTLRHHGRLHHIGIGRTHA
jgi:hypothetical protein